MDQMALTIATAAFFHDIGKFADPELLEVSKEYRHENAGSFLPVFKGNYSHWHALYTAAFIEKCEESIPLDLTAADLGNEDSFIRLAAAHHNPSSAMEHIICLADRISSGMDRETFDKSINEPVKIKDYQKTRLLPIFEHLSLSDQDTDQQLNDFHYRYPLKSHTPESIFPGLKKEVVPQESTDARREYRQLFKGFLESLRNIAHKGVNTELWFEHFDSLVMQFTSTVPAARVGNVIPDVSLYDHLRTTSALATAIYLFHRTRDSLNIKSVQNRDDAKFLIISGNFNGIQKFIFTGYGDSRKYRSKLLRGRSFAVSLLSELAADLICKKVGLPHSSVILNAGGRFSILAPNTEDAMDAAAKVKEIVNEWLIKRTYGETCMTFSMVPATCRNFESSGFSKFWEKVVRSMDEEKFSKIDLEKYGGAVEGYLDGFCNELSPSICPLCGKRPAEKKVVQDDLHVCVMCRDHVFLGENLVKDSYVAIASSDIKINGRKLLDPIFGEYQLVFPQGDPDNFNDARQLVKYWNIGGTPVDDDKLVTSKHINGYVPVYSEAEADLCDENHAGDPKTLNDIASKALEADPSGKNHGIDALGVLKADVDNLGLLMACGLPDRLYTISRLTTLSRQLNDYFAIFLPTFLKKNLRFNDVYTVFAGGDDLFLIGPWNIIIELAGELETSFNGYVCKNKDIHFSAGITIHKSHTPVDVLARDSEHALEESKEGGRNRLTLFDQTIPWSEFHGLEKVKNELYQWLQDGWISNVFLYKINYFIDMAEEEKNLLKKDSTQIHLDDMACTKWRSLLIYSVERNVALNTARELRSERVKYVGSKTAQWLDIYGGKLRIPLWIIQYNRR